MNRVSITTRSLTAGILGGVLSTVVVIATEQAVCYDVGSDVDCNANLGLAVTVGIPFSVFLIIFLVLLRGLSDQAQYVINQREEKDDS